MDQPWPFLPLAARVFTTTRWSVLKACADVDPALAKQALEELCHSYWYPIYATIRRSGRTAEDAQDLTQDFFAKILRTGWIQNVDQEKGRFRFYLLTALRRFLLDHHRRRWTLRRGGGCRIISLDFAQAEAQFSLEPATRATPEALYEQKWAATVLKHALNQLRTELAAKQRPELFDCFEKVILAEADTSFYKEAALRLGMQIGALQKAVCLLRKRLRILLREEVGRTLAVRTESEIDEEIRHLRRVVAPRGPTW